MRSKRIDPDKLLEVLFCVVLMVVALIAMAIGILGNIFLAPLVENDFWRIIVRGFFWIFTVSNAFCFILELVLTIFCLKDKEIQLTGKD